MTPLHEMVVTALMALLAGQFAAVLYLGRKRE